MPENTISSNVNQWFIIIKVTIYLGTLGQGELHRLGCMLGLLNTQVPSPAPQEPPGTSQD